MKNQIGDIYEICTGKGNAYLHFVGSHERAGELIRVLPGLYTSVPGNLVELATSQEQFMLYFMIKAAVRKKLIQKVGFYPATSFRKPKYMRTKHYIGTEFKGWHIVDMDTLFRTLVKTLNPEQKQMSPYGIWNDTYLKEQLEKGFKLDNWI